MHCAELLDHDTVRALAGPASFERGVGYLAEGRVGSITASADAIEATVEGGDPYAVRVSVESGEIGATCSCPMGQGGAFCKHCVALALAWLRAADGSNAGPLIAPGADAVERVDSVRTFLAGLGREALEQLILEELARDEALQARLRLRAAAMASDEDGVASIKRALDRATRPPRILRYQDVPAYAHEVHEAADALEVLVGQGRAASVIGLAERGLRRLEQALEGADDSDGLIGDLLARFQRIHLAACRAARPDPVELARRLFRWELDDDWGVFQGAAETYADVLGEPGLAAYQDLAEAEWAAVPALGPGDQARVTAQLGRFGVTSMMESLARARGDVDMEIAVLSRDLSSDYDFLRIAQVCREHERDDEALDWAERGVRAFPGDTHPGLREFLADAYLDRGRTGEAMALVWSGLAERPSIDDFERLKRYAVRVGAWPAWRRRALDEVRRSIVSELAAYRPRVRSTHRQRRHAWDRPPDGSLLVEILLREDELDAAWEAGAELGCHRGTWLTLARRSEDARPEDAVAVYRREVDALQAVTDKRVYAEVVDLLGRIGRLLAGLGKAGEFAEYAAAVRAANGRRPAFLALYDGAGLPGPRPALRLIKGSARR